MGRDADFDNLIQHIQTWAPSRFAVFPLQAAEPVAEKTPHAVLWGGHGLGFNQLEGFFPVLTRPLSEIIYKNEINYVLWDSNYWPNGMARMEQEGVLQRNNVTKYGSWLLASIQKSLL
jgi:hypothetical protein